MGHLEHDSQRMLSGSDAVAAIILLEDGRYLLQHRDELPFIWYPGHWGCFGGAVDDGEEPMQALARELYEEIEFRLNDAKYFTRFDFDLGELGLGKYYRIYYVVPMSLREFSRLVLHEGSAVEAFVPEDMLKELRVTPYDAFALSLHVDRGRFGDRQSKGSSGAG